MWQPIGGTFSAAVGIRTATSIPATLLTLALVLRLTPLEHRHGPVGRPFQLQSGVIIKARLVHGQVTRDPGGSHTLHERQGIRYYEKESHSYEYKLVNYSYWLNYPVIS